MLEVDASELGSPEISDDFQVLSPSYVPHRQVYRLDVFENAQLHYFITFNVEFGHLDERTFTHMMFDFRASG